MLVGEHEVSWHLGVGAVASEIIESVTPLLDLLLELGLCWLLLEKGQEEAARKSFAVSLLHTINFMLEVKAKVHHTKKALVVDFDDVLTTLRFVGTILCFQLQKNHMEVSCINGSNDLSQPRPRCNQCSTF